MNGVLPAPGAKFLIFKLALHFLLILRAVVISALAYRTLKAY